MMCSLKKNAVIFQVDNNAKDPIIVIEQKYFTKEEPDSTVPLLGIYNGHHYQSVLPASKEDEELTVDIVKYFPNFQGNFKSFLAHKANQQKISKALVSTIVGGNSGSKPTNFGCDVPLLKELNFGIDRKDNGSTKSYKVNVLEQENPKIKLEDGGLNTSDKVTLSEQSNSENEVKDFGSKHIYEKEYKGINRRHQKVETTLEQENYRNKISHERIDSIYEEPALEQENFENEAKTEGIIITTKEQSLEQTNSEIEGKHVEINSSYEKPGSEQQNSGIEATKERISISYKEPALKQDNFEVEWKSFKSSNSYEEQRTKHLYASNTHKKVGGQNLLFLRTTR